MTKQYYRPATPCERLLANDRVSLAGKEQLRRTLAALDPGQLLQAIRHPDQRQDLMRLPWSTTPRQESSHSFGTTVAQQRFWVHKTANVLDKLPKSLQGRAKEMLHDIYLAPTRQDASAAYSRFLTNYQLKYPKACGCPKIKDA